MEMALNGALSVTLDAEFNENASLSGLVSTIIFDCKHTPVLPIHADLFTIP